MTRRRHGAVAGLILLALAAPAGAVTHYVAQAGGHVSPYTNWAAAATNIQAAINACAPWDTVVITNGTYGLTNTVYCTNDVTVQSLNGRDAVHIDGRYPAVTVNAFYLNHGTLDGLTISNAGAHGVKSDYGAVYNCRITRAHGDGIESFTTPRLVTNCTLFVTNTLVLKSGGHGINSCAVDTRIEGCEITASGGSGIQLRQFDTYSPSHVPRMSNALVRTSTISSNLNSGVALGIYWYDPSYPNIPMVIEDCLIEGNTASRGGGVTDAWGTSSDGSSGVEIRRCTIRDNRCGGSGGGGVYLHSSRSPVVSQCTIRGNHSDGEGGGVRGLGGAVDNCLVTDNSAGSSGGGVSRITVRNCTVAGNTAESSAGGVYYATVQNSIVYYNQAPSLENHYLCGFVYSCATPLPGGSGNVSGEPGVIGPRNPRLMSSSPCIDAGNIAYAIEDEDIDGEPRVWGSGVDMGCDEYVSAGVTGAVTAAFVTDAERVVIGTTIRFESRIEGKAQGYVWDMDDGQVYSNTPILFHTYAAPGVYDVVLSVWNLESSDATTGTVSIFGGYTNYVSPSGTHQSPFTNWLTAATNIQDAVSANIPGGEVVVGDGSYSMGGAVARATMTNRVAITNALLVRSVNGPACTAIVGQGPEGPSGVRCAYVGGQGVLIGFTLSNGHTRASAASSYDLRGGGVYAEAGALLSNCLIVGCSALHHGGGVFGGALRSCDVRDCSAGLDGGGTYGASLNYGIVSGNTAGDEGGGVFAGWTEECLIFSNSADQGGGTAWNTNRHCTIVVNTAASSGGGVYKSKLTNCIVYHNTAPIWPNYYNSICSYSCTWPDPEVPGSITNDPELMDVAGGNFHLSRLSPCIDAGAVGGSGSDLDGTPRPLDGDGDGQAYADMGVYEFSPWHYVAPGGGHVWPFVAWSDAAHDIQSAVDAAQDGDGVLVSNGVYGAGGRVMHGSMTNRVVVTNAITVRAVGGFGKTIIEGSRPAGDEAVRGVYLGASASLSGFTLTNGCTRAGGDATNEQSGGGAWCEAGAVISNCLLSGNAAQFGGGGAYGGTLRNCVLAGNTAVARGGGAADATLENCTVFYNHTDGNGGGTYDGTTRNSILYYNTALGLGPNYRGGTIEYSCTTPDPGGTGNITNDPLFTAAYDYHLAAASPCIDTATNLPVLEDVDRVPRPLDGDGNDTALWDMGAHEFPSDLADTDGDGLSDSNEVHVVGSNPTLADTDGDQQTDREEVWAGMNPLSATSYFAVVRIWRSNTPAISWPSATGRLYTVLQSADMTSGWSNAADFVDQPGTGVFMSYTNVAPSERDSYTVRLRWGP